MPGTTRPARSVACPHCGTLSPWSTDNAFRPFCSERCKLIDFGQWATGGYRIPQEEADAGDPESQEPPLER
jgi:endogenous inhibitor of DNA gyrase (YacG/DUF329 family)